MLGIPTLTWAKYGDTSTWVSRIYWGDGQDRTIAYLDFPEDVSHDAAGNFYVADTYNNVIRKVDTNGKVSTLFGTGSYGNGDKELALPKGLAVDEYGDVYVADSDNNAIKKIHNGVSTVLASSLNKPEGVTRQGDIVWFLDTGNNALKQVKRTGGNITTLTTALNAPKKLTLLGNIAYIANSGTHQVLTVDLTTGQVAVLAGTGEKGETDGKCSQASFNNLWGITSDGANQLFVTDGNGFTDFVRKIDLSTCTVRVLATDMGMVSVNRPQGLTYLSDSVYVANSGIGTIHRFNVLNPNDNEIYVGAERFQNDNQHKLLGRPVALTKAKHKRWVYFIENNKIKRIHRKTKKLELIAGSSVDNYREGAGDIARFSYPPSLVINKAGTILYVSDRWNHRIRKVNLITNTVSYLTGAGDINGNGSKNNGYAEGGDCLDEFNAKVKGCAYFNQPAGLVLSADEKYLYVADAGNQVIRKVTIATGKTGLMAGKPQTAGLANGVGQSARFHTPWSMTANRDVTVLYITDRDNHAVRKLDIKNGNVTTLAGNGSAGYADGLFANTRFSLPDSIKFRAKKLYVTEAGGQRIRLLDLNLGVSKLVSGSGTTGWYGGSAKQTEFNGPMGMIIGKRKLLVVDNRNDQIRIVDIRGTAPYTDPAPTVTGVSPASNKVAGSSTDTKALNVFGTNFRYGAVVYFGPVRANQVYVNSSSTLSVELPFGQMQPGYYQVKVINNDGQSSALLRAYSVADANGHVPLADYWAK